MSRFATAVTCSLVSLLALSQPSQAQRRMNQYDVSSLGTTNAGNLGSYTFLPNSSKYNDPTNFRDTTPAGAHHPNGYVSGAITLANGTSQSTSGLRYNMWYGLVEVLDGDGKPKAYRLDDLKGFTLNAVPGAGKQVFEVAPIQSPRLGKGRTFVQVANPTGRLQMLVLHRCVFTPEKVGPLGNIITAEKVGKESLLFTRQPALSLEATEVNFSRKPVLRLFGAQAGIMETYAREQKLSYENPDHVVRLIEHFNTLPVAAAPTK